MGTRTLGSRPWLVADDARDEELALKTQLCAERHAEVSQALPGSEPAGQTVAALLEQADVQRQPALAQTQQLLLALETT